MYLSFSTLSKTSGYFFHLWIEKTGHNSLQRHKCLLRLIYHRVCGTILWRGERQRQTSSSRGERKEKEKVLERWRVKTRKMRLVKKRRYLRESAKFQTAKGRGKRRRQRRRFLLFFFSVWVVKNMKKKWSESDRTVTVGQNNATYLFGHGSMTAQYVWEDWCLSLCLSSWLLFLACILPRVT